MSERACGTREPNGIYFKLDVGPGGRPVEDFLIDPPIELPPGLEIMERGVTMIDRDGTYHLIDLIGRNNYPNVYDFIEEVRHKGVSRRLQKTLDFSKLTRASRLLCVHERALIGNAREIPLWSCPRRQRPHTHENSPYCLGACRCDIEGGVPIENPRVPVVLSGGGSVAGALSTPVQRTLRGGTTYTGYARPVGFLPRYRAAFFASFPASRLEVIRGPQSDENLARAAKAQLDVWGVRE